MTVNFDNLKDPKNEEVFLSELERAKTKLSGERADKFFVVVLNALNSDISQKVSDAIFQVLMYLLSYQKYYDNFVDKGNAARLPFKKNEYTDHVFDILYILVMRAPRCFKQDVADGFCLLIPRRPRKALLILHVYAQYFNNLQNPWPLIDTLLLNEYLFSIDDCAIEYCRLISYLIKNYKAFRDARSKYAFECVATNLHSENVDVINNTYGTLATIAMYETENIDVPFYEIMKHFRFEEFQDSILDFLCAAPIIKEYSDEKFIRRLLRAARRNEKASLFLIRLAENTDNAGIIASHSAWLGEKLPTVYYTLRLFLALFAHKEHRSALGKKQRLITLFQRMVDLKSEQMLSLICTIIRRLHLRTSIVVKMSTSGFLADFFATCDYVNSTSSVHSEILLADTLCRVSFTKEMVPMCVTVKERLKSDATNRPQALQLALDLCNSDRCVRKFRRIKLRKFLEENQDLFQNKSHLRALIKVLSDE